MQLRGLTWDHPRGYNALAAAELAGGPIHWEVQPLEGFESAPIADLCAKYDLVVLDHPHLGEALASDCLQPLDKLFSPADLARIEQAAAGPSYTSYAMHGRQWALPLDAATQVMALRPDLTDQRPDTWEQVLQLSERGKVAVSTAGPHAMLSLLSIAAAIKPGLAMADGGWPEIGVLQEAYQILATLMMRSPASAAGKNPIALLDHMSVCDDIELIPLIYGYVNYSPAKRVNRIAFHNAPRIGSGPPGSIIGGTGIAISAKARLTTRLRDHLLWLLSPEAQKGFIPANAGQPGLQCAWDDKSVNTAWSGFYQNTIETLRHSTIRPRHDGYIALQSQASAYLRDAGKAQLDAAMVARNLTEMFAANQAKVRTVA